MKPLLFVLPAVACLVAVVAWGVMALNGAGSHGRVYRVAEAHILLIHTPKLWVRRSLLVRGRLDGCSPAPAPCSIWQPRLFDPDQPTVRTALPVERATDTRGLFLQTLLAYLFPKARLPQWGSLGTFRVQVRATPIAHCATGACDTFINFDAFACDSSACYTALVTDAGPL